MMTLDLTLLFIMDATSVLVATVTMLTMGLLVGLQQDATIDGADPNRLDWLGYSLRPFLLRLS